MAVAFISSANPINSSSLLPSNPPPPSIFSSPSSPHSSYTKPALCRAIREPKSAPICVSKRGFALNLTASFLLSLGGSSVANAAILEADDDVELLEKVKKDRERRIQRQGVINSSKQETGYLQEVVYKLSEVGQAIENNDLKAASSVLGSSTDTEWIKKANSAFNKLSSSPEQKAEVDSFNSSMSKLISSVDQRDVNTSKISFVSSAIAFEKWTLLTGLGEKLKGL